MENSAEDKKKMLREIIRQLQSGVSPVEVKEKFKRVLEGTGSEDIARIEQELVKEGLPREELQRLCDVHLAVFGDQVQEQELHIPLGHPINILVEEHKYLLERVEKLGIIVKMFEEACDVVYVGDELTELQSIVKDFQDSEKHYLREENVLFPMMEKHGITEPPAVLWIEHNKIRDIEKKLHILVEKWNTTSFQDFKTQLTEVAKPLCNVLPSHFFKENNILFPTALQTIQDEEEWEEARKEFDEIGYCRFTPPRVLSKPEPSRKKVEIPSVSEGVLQFENGKLSKDEVEGIFDSLPIDISFIDKDDRVKYFNKAEKRIFVRTKAVLGRNVQLCHPEKSVHVVNKIIEAFETGERDTAEFWIQANNRLILIRYYAVRGKNKKYIGTMEVTQDITDLKRIEGQKKLLDWKE